MSKELTDSLLVIFTIGSVILTGIQLMLLIRTDQLINTLKPIISAYAELSVKFGNTKAGETVGLSSDATELLITISNTGIQVAKEVFLEFALDPIEFGSLSSDLEFVVTKRDLRFNRSIFVPTKPTRFRRRWIGWKSWLTELKRLLRKRKRWLADLKRWLRDPKRWEPGGGGASSRKVSKPNLIVKAFPNEATVIQILPQNVLHPMQSMEFSLRFRLLAPKNTLNHHFLRYTIFCIDFQPRRVVNAVILSIEAAS